MTIAFELLTIFPEMFASVMDASILGRAQKSGLIAVNLHNLRDWADDRHKTTDDYPYGGGAGMVMKVEPFFKALTDLTGPDLPPATVVLMSPQGERFNHQLAATLSRKERLIILCGRYEGYDERVRKMADLELSIGDYVLTGGELAAMVVVDAVARLAPGVVGDADSTRYDSHAQGLLEHPHYTRPAEFNGMKVPDVLLEGHHAKIEEWRRRQSIIRTARRRPDLLDRADLTPEERKLADRAREGQIDEEA